MSDARRVPALRAARYVALSVITCGMLAFALTCSEWRERRNVFVFLLPLGFFVNALSTEILFSKLRKGQNPPE
jgi:uncharacterized membrane protein